jgi:uncharacterized protein YPO0396
MTTYDTTPLFTEPTPVDRPQPDLLPASDRLFGIAGSTPGTTQWRAERLQLVQWGGFTRETVTFDRESTLLSGASGTGKSTLLDAWTTLMMPSSIPLNGASNQGAGRARGSEQRSVLSYLRGQTGTITGEDGIERPKVTRGDGAATWGAIAMVFVDDNDEHFTVARLYYVHPGGNIIERHCTAETAVDLAGLEDLVPDKFPPKALRARGIEPHETVDKFFMKMFSGLGIGANGDDTDGSKALLLLARVQAGQQIRTVDALYKDMVLERPETYKPADTALKHFAALDDLYRKMKATQRKREILKDIDTYWERLTSAREQILGLTDYGIESPGPSSLTLWCVENEARLVTHTQTINTERKVEEENQRASADEEARKLKDRLRPLEAEFHKSGGGELESLAGEIAELRRLEAARQQFLVETVEVLPDLLEGDIDLADRVEFDRLKAEGAELIADFDQRRAEIDGEIEEVQVQLRPLLERSRALGERLRVLGETRSRVSPDLIDLRAQVCRAAGLDVGDAPFLAELVAVPEGEARWTAAAEVVLGGEARRMLVPAERLDEFSAAIDGLKLRGRLRFTGAERGLPIPQAAGQDTVAGKLQFKQDSPYHGWVARRVADPALNAVCVEDARGLAGPGRRVTVTGQVRQGMRGEHGRWEQTNVLGFNNKDLIEQTQTTKEGVDEEITRLGNQRDPLVGRKRLLERRHSQHLRFSSVQLEQVDVYTPRREAAQKDARRQQILADSDRLTSLKEDIELLEGLIGEQEAAKVLHTRALKAIDEVAIELSGRGERLGLEEASLRRQGVSLSDDQAAGIRVHFVAACGKGEDPDDLDRWPAHLARLRERLSKTLSDARAEQVRSSKDLTTTFAEYLREFPDPRLTADVGCYDDFARIRQELSDSQMAEQKESFRKTMVAWSGQDLVGLLKAIESSYLEISARLDPINMILRTLKFGPSGHYLRMNPRKKIPSHVTEFTAELAAIAGAATTVLADEQIERRYQRAARLLARLRGPKDDGYDPRASERDVLLDVRRNIEVVAEEHEQDGGRVATYTALSAKSGGETQELIAFIIGSALRYRLGDEDRSRPRFAPVFLDEAFIKADPEHTERAVTAWAALNFQLIVGAPIQMVSALEPHMNKVLLTTKNKATNQSRVRSYDTPKKVRGAEEAW